jgi:hypothetical protein
MPDTDASQSPPRMSLDDLSESTQRLGPLSGLPESIGEGMEKPRSDRSAEAPSPLCCDYLTTRRFGAFCGGGLRFRFRRLGFALTSAFALARRRYSFALAFFASALSAASFAVKSSSNFALRLDSRSMTASVFGSTGPFCRHGMMPASSRRTLDPKGIGGR